MRKDPARRRQRCSRRRRSRARRARRAARRESHILLRALGSPLPRPVKLVYARAPRLGMPKIGKPTQQQIDEWHAKYERGHAHLQRAQGHAIRLRARSSSRCAETRNCAKRGGLREMERAGRSPRPRLSARRAARPTRSSAHALGALRRSRRPPPPTAQTGRGSRCKWITQKDRKGAAAR